MNQRKINWGIFFVLLWVLALTIPALTFSQESNQPAPTPPGTAAPAAPAETPPSPAVPSAPSAAAPAPQAKLDKGDNAWMLTSSALVLMMTIPGLFLFYGGLVRGKNVLGTIMHSFIIVALISIQWVLWGYSVAFGPDVGGIIGNLDWFGLNGVGTEPNADYAATIPHQTFMVYQMMFAIITPALDHRSLRGASKIQFLCSFYSSLGNVDLRSPWRTGCGESRDGCVRWGRWTLPVAP